MSLNLRKGVVSFAAVIVGLLGAAVSSGAASSNRAKPSGPCGLPAPARPPTRSPFSEAAPRRPVLIGAVRVAAGRRAWVVQAPLGRAASYVSQSFTAASGVSVKFCLRAPQGAATRIVGLQPGGISLSLHGGHVALAVSRRGRLSRAAHPRSVAGRPTAVELAVNGNGKRVDLYVGGREQDSFRGGATAPSVVRVGSLVPARANRVALTGMTVTTCAGPVIPAPASTAPSATAPSPNPPSSQPGTASPGSTPAPAPPAASAGSVSAGSASTGSVPTSLAWPGRPFSRTSFWNAPLAADAPLDPNSQAYVNDLVRQVNSYGSWMNTTAYSTAVYVVPADEPVQHVTLDTWGPDLQAAFDAVPIPCGAQSASGTDAQMVVWQPSSNRMWEFWQMHQESDGWHARWGGEIDDLSGNPGYFTHTGLTNNWGATATGLPLLGGLVTQADLRRGYINHALAISLVETAPAEWSWPAQRTDGGFFTPGITPAPEGTRFRLDPSVNIGGLNLPPIDRMLAQAAQTYGMVVRDKAGAVVFYGQDPVNLPTDPWPAAFENQYPNKVLALFPWSDLEALQTQLSCCWQPS